MRLLRQSSSVFDRRGDRAGQRFAEVLRIVARHMPDHDAAETEVDRIARLVIDHLPVVEVVGRVALLAVAVGVRLGEGVDVGRRQHRTDHLVVAPK